MKAVPGHHTSWRKVLRDSMTLKSWMGNTEWPCEVLHGNSERCGQVGEHCRQSSPLSFWLSSSARSMTSHRLLRLCRYDILEDMLRCFLGRLLQARGRKTGEGRRREKEGSPSATRLGI